MGKLRLLLERISVTEKKKEAVYFDTVHRHYLLVERNCPHCRNFLGVIQRINAKLPPERIIRVIDTTEFQTEGLGIAFEPIIDKLEWEDTPFLYLDGTVVPGMTTPTYAEWYLNGRLKNEFV